MTSNIGQDFLSDINREISLQDALNPRLKAEAELRRLFATERNSTSLDDPYVGLVDIYESPESIKLTQAREINSPSDRDAKHVFPLKQEQRRATGEPAMTSNLDQFRTSWNIFTEGALSQLTDWNNVVAAGGAVLASLLPLPERAKGSKRAIRKYFHEETYSTSDIDLFLYGLTPEQAEKKAIQIYHAVRDSVPWDTVCARTRNAISIHSQFPYRSVQIILRLYKSPAEILAGFDIDCACFLYDGSRVMGNPRAIAALMSQSNQVDMTRRSPSYEVRLAKYAVRGFEVHVPNLNREDIDPTIFERSINRIEGLARLLVLERLSDPEDRTKYLENRRQLRGRPENQGYSRRAMRRRKRVKGDLKAAAEQFGGLSSSDYGTQSFHIPYGPGFDSKKVEKFIYGTDLGMNSTFNPKNKDRRLHRHPAFFGTMQEVMEDCCEYCPEPVTPEEKEMQVEEDKQFVRGRISFIEEDPGRQMMTGSFHPIDEGEWALQVYLGPVEKLFQAVSAGDKETVVDIVENGFDLQKRDHVGRTSLQLAIMNKNTEIAAYLIENGARITSRLVDGRTALHLAAQLGLADVVTLLLEKSKKNEIKAEEEKAAAEAAAKPEEKENEDAMDSEDEHTTDNEDEDMRPSSEDDWESDEENPKKKKGKKGDDAKATTAVPTVNDPPAEGAAIPEDNEELPDILDINVNDWDFEYSAICHAIVEGHLPVVDVLVRAGADIQTPFKKGTNWAQATYYPLTLTLFTEDENAACRIAERLLEGGASCTAADDSLITVFHRAVLAGKLALVRTFLRVDPNSKTAIDFLPQIGYQNAISPLVSAIGLGDRAMSALLIASGASVSITEQMFDKSWDARQSLGLKNAWRPSKQGNQFLADTMMPVEVSLASRNDLAFPLIQLGADLNLGLRYDHRGYNANEDGHATLLDKLEEQIEIAQENLKIYEAWQEKGVATSSPKNPSYHTTWSDSDANNTFVGWLTATHKSYILDKQKEYEKEDENELKKNAEVAQRMKAKEDEIIAARLDGLIKFAQIQLQQLQEVKVELVAHGGKTRIEIKTKKATSGSARPRRRQTRYQSSWTHASNTISEEGLATLEKTDGKMPVIYKVFRSHSWNNEVVGSHIAPQYEQLFEACWKGNSRTVEKLCLPPKTGNAKGTKDTAYLQVAAEVLPDPKLTQAYAQAPYSNAFRCGLSTLDVAIMAKQWATAKVIIAIAKAQHEKGEERPKTYTAPLLSESDDEDSDSEMSVDEEDERVTKPILIDLANRLSTVKTPSGPERFFDVSTVLWGDEILSGSPLDQAIDLNDLELLENILELRQMCEPAITFTESESQTAIYQDNPEMLDFAMRRFGHGIILDTEDDEEEQDNGGEEKKKKKKIPKMYLGLNFHGRKRKDLASKGDPDAPDTSEKEILPPIWTAARHNSEKVLRWLATSGPLEAYKAYMQAAPETDERAQALRRLGVANLERQLPSLLGATSTRLGENAVLAHLTSVSPELKTIKLLFELWPNMKTSFVHQRLEGLNMTPLLYICATNQHKEIFDFFLAQRVDPLVVDYRGRNILHSMAYRGHLNLLEHAFTKLNQEQLAILLSQQTRNGRNSPLMSAVKAGRQHIVGFLLKYDQPVTAATLNMRDAQGTIPLHHAIVQGRKEIVGALIETAQTYGKNSLFVENGVGSTPLELARFQYRLSNARLPNQSVSPVDWNGFTEDGPKELTVDAIRTTSSQRYQKFQAWNEVKMEDVETLEQIIQSLDAEGRFGDKPKTRDVLVAYILREKEAAKVWSECASTKERIKDMEVKVVQEAQQIDADRAASSSSITYYPSAESHLNKINRLGMTADTDKGNIVESSDLKATYDLVQEAVKQSPVAMKLKNVRELVHLMDAQMVVDSALKAATMKPESSPKFIYPGHNDGNRMSWYAKQQGVIGVDMKEEEDKSNTFRYLLDFSRVTDNDY